MIWLFHVKSGGCLTQPNPEVDDKNKHYKLQSLGIMSSQKLQLPVTGEACTPLDLLIVLTVSHW